MAYKPDQIYAALVAQGVPANDAATLTQISGAESGFGAKTVSPVNHNGSIDYGVFQINGTANPQFGGPAMATAPLDRQAAAAAAIYKSQGLTAWTTFKTGAYQAFPSGASGPAVLANGPPDTSSGLNAGSAGGGGLDLSTGNDALTNAAEKAAVAAGNAALMAMGIPPFLSGGGDNVTVDLGKSSTDAINSVVKATGGAFNDALTHTLAALGINFSALQNWFVRAGVILLGLVVIALGLIGLLWDHGGKEIATKAAGAVALAA